MRLVLFLNLSLAVLLTGGCQRPQPMRGGPEITVRSDDEDYKVDMPGPPQSQEQAATDRNGQVVVGRGWETKRLDYPADFYVFAYPAPADQQVDGWLEAICQNVARKKAGKVMYVKELMLQGHEGRETLIQGTGPKGIFYEVCRFYAANDKLYCTGVAVNTKEQATAEYVRRFHDSFSFLAR